MRIYRKIILAAMCCLTALGSMAQNGFNMPLSQFGIGSSELPYTMPMVSRMGGVAYTLAGNNFTNPFNPASYASIEPESFVFDMGLGLQYGVLRKGNDHLPDMDGNLGYLTFAMPITRWWKVGAGLLPYSMVSYESVTRSESEDYGAARTIYDGTGSVNQVFVGSAFNVMGKANEGRRLQVGFNVNYLTGTIQRAISYAFPGNDSTYYMNGRRYKRTRLNNVVFDFGAQYWHPLNEHYTLGVGLVYKPMRDMNVKDLSLIYTYHSSDESLVDTIFPHRGEDPEYTSRLELDHTFGVGLSLERNRRWRVAADATFAGWAGMKYTEGSTTPIFGESSLRYGPYSRYALGFERSVNMDASSYWGRIGWSIGVHTERGSMYLMLDGKTQQINEWGGGLGATLPMRKGKSLLSISLAYSSIGSRDLLQRNCLTLGISVSSCEHWFFKRKFN